MERANGIVSTLPVELKIDFRQFTFGFSSAAVIRIDMLFSIVLF